MFGAAPSVRAAVMTSFGVCVLCWVHLSPTHSSAVNADCLPFYAPAACVSVAVE